MPLVTPSNLGTMQMVDRLIALLAADTDLTDLFDLPIRDFPPDGVTAADEVVVSIHAVDGDFFPHTMNQMRRQPRCILTVMIYEAEGAATATIAANYRRLVNVTEIVQNILRKYYRDPTPGTCYWYAINFPSGNTPTVEYLRKPQAYQVSRTQFELRQREAVAT